MKRILIITIAILLVAYVGLAWFFSNLVLTTNSSHDNTQSRIERTWGVPHTDYLKLLPEPQDFTTKGYEDIDLHGVYFKRSDTADCAIIFAHGWSDTWEGMLKYVPVMQDCTCDFVFYDHRAHGKSGGEYPTGGIKESKDLLAVTEWTKQYFDLSGEQIGWIGASWGGATALEAGATDENVAFIISDAPYQDWHSAIFERAVRDYGSWVSAMAVGVEGLVGMRAGIDFDEASAVTAAKSIEEPVLLIHSKQDSQTESWQSVNIAKNLNEKSTFHHLDWGNDHTADVRKETEKFKGLIDDFLEEVGREFLK